MVDQEDTGEEIQGFIGGGGEGEREGRGGEQRSSSGIRR